MSVILAAILDFSKILLCTKLQQILLKLVENMCLQPQIGIYLRIESKRRKRLSQQPALGALTYLQSFVAGKANFCNHLLASLVHFTVVKSQAILIIRLGVTEVIYHSSWGHRSYFHRNFISSASFKRRNFYLVGYAQAQQFYVWALLINCCFDSYNVSV